MTTTAGAGLSGYLRNIWTGFWSCLSGMGITWKYFWKKPVTYEYPETREAASYGDGLPAGPPSFGVAERFRGIHRLEQDLCIFCMSCKRACPVDCIEIEAARKPGKVLEWKSFRIDYGLCLFCGLCVEACPKSCLEMGNEYSLVRFEGSDLTLELLGWKGLREKDLEAIRAAEEKAKKKKDEEGGS